MIPRKKLRGRKRRKKPLQRKRVTHRKKVARRTLPGLEETSEDTLFRRLYCRVRALEKIRIVNVDLKDLGIQLSAKVQWNRSRDHQNAVDVTLIEASPLPKASRTTRALVNHLIDFFGDDAPEEWMDDPEEYILDSPEVWAYAEEIEDLLDDVEDSPFDQSVL